jgi:hypothetical protein
VNSEQTEHILSLIAAHYWQKVNKTPEQMALMVGTWTTVFADLDIDDVVTALNRWIRDDDEGWPPQAGQLRAIVKGHVGIKPEERRPAVPPWTPPARPTPPSLNAVADRVAARKRWRAEHEGTHDA